LAFFKFLATLSLARRIAVAGFLALLVIVAIKLGANSLGKTEKQESYLATDEIVILRTQGGMLEVATLVRNEGFQWSTSHTCPILDCERLLGKTTSEVRVPVHYTYRIPLEAEWKLKFETDHFVLSVPKLEPKLPAAIEVAKLQIRTDTTWTSPNVLEHRESLIRNLGPTFDQRGKQKAHIDAAREGARKTIVEFAQKWMLEQSVPASKRGYPIRVHFADEKS